MDLEITEDLVDACRAVRLQIEERRRGRQALLLGPVRDVIDAAFATAAGDVMAVAMAEVLRPDPTGAPYEWREPLQRLLALRSQAIDHALRSAEAASTSAPAGRP